MSATRPRVAIDARTLGERFTSNRTYWQELLAALAKRSQVELVLFSDQPLSVEASLANLEQIVVPARSSRLWSWFAFPAAVSQATCDLVHVQYTVSPRFRVPAITTIHDVSYFINPQWFSPKDRFLLRRSVPASTRRAARVIAVSETSKREIMQFVGTPADRIVVTPLGVPSYIHSLPVAESLKTVNEVCAAGDRYLLSVGSIQPRKNWRLLFQACALARKSSSSDLKLVVTGPIRDDQAAVDACVAEVGGKDWIIFAGGVPQDALSSFYSGALALVHTSLHEGFGLTPLEAFACGTPVVASRAGAIPEIAEGAATLVEGWAVEDWASAILSSIEPLRAGALRAAGFERAKQYSWDVTAQRTEDAYREASVN
jgi:glycosyltransferase involved in cell wall biosynthesis